MASMTEEAALKAKRLIDEIQEEEIQSKLKGGFERDFSNSVIAQWDRAKYLSARQMELLEDVIERHKNPQRRGSFSSRRYEGYGR